MPATSTSRTHRLVAKQALQPLARRAGRLAWLVWIVATWLIATAWPSAWAQATQPPTEPVLRIEAGMHTAVIRGISNDAQGRWAVTASVDKTARVWDVASGRLLQVLRPPLGAGDEGKLYAAAMSPDGAVVAVAGWTGHEWTGKVEVYLFNRSTGQLIRRLGGLPNVINHLAFSPDGRWLAAGLSKRNGVRVWRWADGSAPMLDAGYGGDSYGAHFGPAGPAGQPLVTSSWDGQVRLYRLAANAAPGSAIQPVQAVAATGGKRPFGVAFSPDGRLVAVGYHDSTRVDVLDGSSLALRYSPSTVGMGNGSLMSVAFSADGQTLAAGGLWNVNGMFPVRRWPQAGQGQPQDTPTAGNSLQSLAPLPGGGWLVGAGDPAWGQLQADGRWLLRGQPPTADLRGSTGDSAFLLADSGRMLQFGYEPSGKAPHQFDLRQRRLSAGALSGGQPPRTQGLAVEGWANTTRPTLNEIGRASCRERVYSSV